MYLGALPRQEMLEEEEVLFFFFKFIYFERECVCVCEQGRGRDCRRERIPSRLCTLSTEPETGLEPMT